MDFSKAKQDAESEGTEKTQRSRKGIRLVILLLGGFVLFVIFTIWAAGNYSKTGNIFGISAPQPHAMVTQPTATATDCPTFAGDQICWLTKTRTGWISTGSAAGLQPCFGPPMSPDAPYDAWYLTSDGTEYHWDGTAEDKARKPAFFSFRAKYSDHFPLHYGLC